jgi:hypothetical protein
MSVTTAQPGIVGNQSYTQSEIPFNFGRPRHQYAAHLLYTIHYIRTPTFPLDDRASPCFVHISYFIRHL